MSLKNIKTFAAATLIAGAGVFANAPTASASTIDIISWDAVSPTTVWRVAAGTGTFEGYTGAHLSGTPSGAGTLAVVGKATGYNLQPSNPATELAAFHLISGLSGFSAVKDDNGDGAGSYRKDPDGTTWGWITAEYFSLKGAGYTAFFHNEAATPFRVNLSKVSDTTGDTLSHVTEYLAPVPAPAAGFLLIGALGSLVALRRRRKTA